jgi:hypothetical protein
MHDLRMMIVLFCLKQDFHALDLIAELEANPGYPFHEGA